MEAEFMSIAELSKYLGIKISTLYSKTERGELPHYKMGRLVRFKKTEIDEWLTKQKKDAVDIEKQAREIVKGIGNKKEINIDSIVKKAIADTTGTVVKSNHQKTSQSRASRKGERNGNL